MKNLLAAALISGMAVSAQAGSITYEAPDNAVVEIEPNMSISGNWIIPAVIASVVLLVILTKQEQQLPQ